MDTVISPINKVELVLATLKQTEGYEKLSEFQKRFIRLSLYCQERADREGSGYSFTVEAMEDWFCHAAVLALEEGCIPGISPREEFPLSFFEGSYSYITNKSAAKRKIEKCGFPCVVNANSRKTNTGRCTQYHTFLALGHDETGEIVVWEKEGYLFPFRVAYLEWEIDKYSNFFWGTRPLRNSKGTTKITFIQKFLRR